MSGLHVCEGLSVREGGSEIRGGVSVEGGVWRERVSVPAWNFIAHSSEGTVNARYNSLPVQVFHFWFLTVCVSTASDKW